MQLNSTGKTVSSSGSSGGRVSQVPGLQAVWLQQAWQQPASSHPLRPMPKNCAPPPPGAPPQRAPGCRHLHQRLHTRCTAGVTALAPALLGLLLRHCLPCTTLHSCTVLYCCTVPVLLLLHKYSSCQTFRWEPSAVLPSHTSSTTPANLPKSTPPPTPPNLPTRSHSLALPPMLSGCACACTPCRVAAPCATGSSVTL